MAEESIFVHAFFKVDLKWRWLNDVAKQESAKEFISIINERKDIQYRSYSTLGIREETDFLIWLMSDELEKIQDLISKLQTTILGKYLMMSLNFISMTKPSIYTPKSSSAFASGEKPLKYAIVYPFIKSREWYLLPFEERKKMMEEHGMVGRKFPQIKRNTTYSFGLDDQDFMLTFETDDLVAFQDLMMQLRETQVSRYVVKDTPMIVCIYKPLEEILASLG